MYCDVHTGLAGLRVDLSLDASGNHLLNLPSPHEHNPVSHSARQSTKDFECPEQTLLVEVGAVVTSYELLLNVGAILKLFVACCDTLDSKRLQF